LRLAQYEIQERIGKGGMGVVYKARDTHLGRIVAIKVLPPLVSNDPERRSRFLREAQAAANLNHPNIATVYQFGPTEVKGSELATPVDDFSQTREVLFLAMEYVEGEDLQAKIGREGLAVSSVIGWGIQIAEGLEAAHQAGVIHRDLKPNNIRITHDGRVKLLDFGLAKVRDEHRSPPGESVAEVGFQTSQGMLLGTPPYMAPEMLKGEAVDHRSDLFSLGVVLFQLLAGEPPYPAENLLEYVKALSEKGPRSLRELRPDVTPDQEAVLERLLSHEPADRFDSAAEVARALRAVGGAAPTTPVTQLRHRPSRRRSWAASRPVLVAASLLTLALALGLLWRLGAFRSESATFAGNATVALFPFSNLSSERAYDMMLRSQFSFLVSELGQLPAVNIILPGDSGDESNKPRTEAARRLGADAFLEGSLQQDQDLLLLAANLVDSRSSLLLWSQTYKGTSRQLQDLQRTVARDFNLLLRTWHYVGQTRRINADDLIDLGASSLKDSTEVEEVQQATRLFDLAIKSDDRFSPAFAGRSGAMIELFKRTGDEKYLAMALDDAERAVRLAPDSVGSLMALGLALRESGEFEPAIRQFEAAKALSTNSADALLELAITYQVTDRLPQAEETLRAAVAAEPESWDVLNQLGLILLSTGRRQEARQMFERAEALAPPGTVWPTGNLVVMATQEGNFAKALKIAQKLPEPLTDAEHASNVGTAHFFLGDLEQAEIYYKRSIELSPGNARLYRNLGDVLELRGRAEESRAAFLQAATIQATKAEIVHNLTNRTRLALYQAKAGLCDASAEGLGTLETEAIETFEQALYVAQASAVCKKSPLALRFLRLAIQLGYPREAAPKAAEFQNLDRDAEFLALTSP
jgi:eukaryotic-like serine/threonine-protein kinase